MALGLKINGWKMNVLLGRPIFRGELLVSRGSSVSESCRQNSPARSWRRISSSHQCQRSEANLKTHGGGGFSLEVSIQGKPQLGCS